MKYLRNASEALAKTHEKHLKPLQKYMLHPDKTLVNIL
jgi:hypothetical protein